MPPPTSTLKPKKETNGAVPPAPTPTPGASADKSLSKPDQAKYNAEQDAINKDIAGVKAKLDTVRSRISLGQSPGSNDRRTTLKAEMDGLRGEQGKFKADRTKTLEEVKRLQENVQKKIKDAQASRGKLSFKSVGEIDDRISPVWKGEPPDLSSALPPIEDPSLPPSPRVPRFTPADRRSLDRQIESGSMKLVDEKKALAEITTLRRSRKTLEASGSIDDAIAADRARIDELKKQLDDPESRKVSDKFDALKKEMDGLREEGNKAYEERNKLFDERNALSAQLDELYGKKRESASTHRDANDKYYAKVQADRNARQERFKAEKAKEDASRREEEIVRLREEAKNPAYAAELEDCSILIGWFKGKYGGEKVPTTNAGSKAGSGAATASLQGVKELEIRQVDSDFKGMTLKKKGDDEELGGLFGGGFKGKGKKGKKSAAPSGTATPSEGSSSASGAVNLPMSLLSALLSLGIPPPSGKEDVSRTIEDLETKKAWYQANSESKTKAEVERVEKLVAKMQKKNAVLNEGDDEEEAPTSLGESGGAKEPNHTVAVSGGATGPETVDEEVSELPKDASPTEEVKHVDMALEEIKENES